MSVEQLVPIVCLASGRHNSWKGRSFRNSENILNCLSEFLKFNAAGLLYTIATFIVFLGCMSTSKCAPKVLRIHPTTSLLVLVSSE